MHLDRRRAAAPSLPVQGVPGCAFEVILLGRHAVRVSVACRFGAGSTYCAAPKFNAGFDDSEPRNSCQSVRPSVYYSSSVCPYTTNPCPGAWGLPGPTGVAWARVGRGSVVTPDPVVPHAISDDSDCLQYLDVWVCIAKCIVRAAPKQLGSMGPRTTAAGPSTQSGSLAVWWSGCLAVLKQGSASIETQPCGPQKRSQGQLLCMPIYHPRATATRPLPLPSRPGPNEGIPVVSQEQILLSQMVMSNGSHWRPRLCASLSATWFCATDAAVLPPCMQPAPKKLILPAIFTTRMATLPDIRQSAKFIRP
jgi:hypothetical protein